MPIKYWLEGGLCYQGWPSISLNNISLVTSHLI